jgi:capsular exopolysaccharide synthesis family protein
MNLRDYLSAVRKRWWLVVCAVAVALGGASTITILTPPQYAASVTFFVNAQTKGGVTDAYQGDLFSQKRVASYVDLLTSDRLATMIVENRPIGLTAGQVQQRISAQAVPDTVLLKVTVTDGDRERALKLTSTLAEQFVILVQQLETPPGSNVPSVRVDVIAGPSAGTKPVAPQPLRNSGLALVLGLIVGIGAAALREAMDTTVKSGEQLTELADTPVLAAIPYDPKARQAPLITQGSAQSTRAEALRQLRTNLRFVSVDREIKTIAVSSAIPNEGKSTTACNLAIVLAEAGKRVVLVDADLRRPRIAEYLGLEGAIGITNVLAGYSTLDQAVQQWGGTGLFALPSGTIPPNPSELLGSRHMVDMLAALRNTFDVIIIDTPPLLPVTDAAVLSAAVDGTIQVIRYGKTTTTQARSAAASLAAVDSRPLGFVLNMVPQKGAGAYTYYDYRSKGPSSGKHSGPPVPPIAVSSPVYAAAPSAGDGAGEPATRPTADVPQARSSATHGPDAGAAAVAPPPANGGPPAIGSAKVNLW